MSVRLVKEWLRKAEEDYQAALVLSRKRKSLFRNTVCFHSQQAAEKYLKAYLCRKKLRFPKTHDLILLRSLCAQKDADFELITDLVLALNPYAVEYRYPGEQATARDAKKAFCLSKDIRDFLLPKLQKRRKRA